MNASRMPRFLFRAGAVFVVVSWLAAAIATNCCRPGEEIPHGFGAGVRVQGTPFRSPATAAQPEVASAASPADAPDIPGSAGTKSAGEQVGVADDGVPAIEPPPVAKGARPPANKPEPEALELITLGNFEYAPPPIERDDEGEVVLRPWPDPVPQRIYDLDGKRISVEGYVIPLDYREETFTRFLLAQFMPACCFGDTIRPNQWIQVEMEDDKRVKFAKGPNRVVGVLQVVAHDSEDALTMLYRMTGESVEAVE